MLNKLVLGTANFGLNYGIANKKKLTEKEISDILQAAKKYKMWGLDTAQGYGNAEQIIGRYIKDSHFSIITKLSNKKYITETDVTREIKTSLSNLHVEKIDILLIHSFDNYQKYKETIVKGIYKLIKKGLVRQWGVSVYHINEVEQLLEDGNSNFAVEFPVNLFDRRFLVPGFIEKLKQKNCFLVGRSVFLQGLLMLQPDNLQGNLITVKKEIKKLIQLSRVHKIPVSAIALLFVLTQNSIDKVIIGVDSKEQLSQNIASVGYIERYKNVVKELDSLEVVDESIILPYKWDLKK